MKKIFSFGQRGSGIKYIILLVISIMAVINDTAASWSICCATRRSTGEVICGAVHASCGEVGNLPLNGFYCKDLGALIVKNPPHPISLHRESGGKASFTIE